MTDPSARRAVVTTDVVIIGGGVMGSACAWKLARSGCSVVVLEKSVPGAEASSAAAGILGAHAEAHGAGPMADLLLASLARYPGWANELADATGIDIEFRRSGVLRIGTDDADVARLQRETAWMGTSGRAVEHVDAEAVQKLEGALAGAAGGVRFPTDARVDPKLFFRAIHVAAQRAGARFETGAYVRQLIVEGGRARGVSLEGNIEYRANTIVVAAGSWSTLVPGAPIAERAVIPARGQIVELDTPAPSFSHVIMGPRCYLVPRDDGRVLVGSTLEFVGYRREVTARAVRDLLDGALSLVPKLGDATVRASWSNFRPYTPDELPVLGESQLDGLLFATGHYRNGILLAPITAELVRALVLGETVPFDMTPFAASRLARP